MGGAVLYVGGFILPDRNAAANRVVSNGKIFELLGHRTVFLGAADINESFSGIRPVDNSELFFEQSRPKGTKEWLKRMFDVSEAEKLVKKFGIKAIILYNQPYFTLAKYKKVFSPLGIKIIYDCTEWTKYTDGSLPKRLFKVFDEMLIRSLAHKKADGIIAVSNRMKNKYRSARALLILPPLTDITGIFETVEPINPKDKFEFCFAGVPDGNKDSLDLVIKSFRKLDSPDAALRIVGMTRDDVIKCYPGIDENEGWDRNIDFVGFVSHEKAIGHLKACDCSFFLRIPDSRNNAGFPTKFAEAVTCGLPVIASNVSDISDYIDYTGGKIISACDSDEAAPAMQEIMSRGKKKPGLNDAFDYHNYVDVTGRFLDEVLK